MKKALMIPLVMISGILVLQACNGTDADKTAMKSPVESVEATSNKATVTMNKEEAKTKTIANLQTAFKGETTASAKYAAYSKKAEQEGHHEIALLFKAASVSEKIHADNHRAVLQEAGIAAAAVKPAFSVLSTKENLEDAIKGESYEVATMYPEFLTIANDADNQVALISLNYAYKTEKKHKVFYDTALAALNNALDKTLPALYYICPTCGNTYEKSAPARCGISMTSGSKFIQINSL